MQVFDYAQDGEAAERSYIAWTEAHLHRNGYVINRRGQTYMLHVAGCEHFYDEASGRKLTVNPKTCLESLDEVALWERAHGAINLVSCRSCKPR